MIKTTLAMLAPGPTPMHDKSFYFSDGDVVLSAPGKAGDDEAIVVAIEASNSNITPNIYSQTPAVVVYFRIHKALLIEQPSMFTDMFDLMNPSISDQDLCDGIPLITLHDDASHVRGFLRVLSNPETAFLPRYHHQSPKLLMGPLLLAVKYQADALRDTIVLHLRADWPANSYAAWKKRQWQDPTGFPSGVAPNPEPFIHLVRTTNTSELLRKHLALAFYALLSRRPSTWRTDLLDAEDLITLVTARCTINAWLITWIKEDPSTYYFYGRKAQGKGPQLGIRQSGCSCKLKEFEDELLLDWMEHSLENVDVIEYLEHLAVMVEANGYRWRFCNRSSCRSKAVSWVKEMARVFYDTMEEIIFPSHAPTAVP